MEKKKQAPLVEVIFEVRWGTLVQDDGGAPALRFEEEDVELFAGAFKAGAHEQFPVYKRTNETAPRDLPHVVTHQFWTAPDTWPCLQVGVGIMTVNQADKGYEWAKFREACKRALEILNKSHHRGLDGLPAMGVELRYQDGLPLSDGESDADFVRNRAQITLKTPPEFLKSDALESVIENHNVAFTVPVLKPKAILINQLNKVQLNLKPGFLQTTVVRSNDTQRPEFSIDALMQWLEQAHDVQRHVYETLIRPTHEQAS